MTAQQAARFYAPHRQCQNYDGSAKLDFKTHDAAIAQLASCPQPGYTSYRCQAGHIHLGRLYQELT